MEKALETIAKTNGIETLKAQHSDDKDFHDIAVWRLREMLEEAYKKGMEDANK